MAFIRLKRHVLSTEHFRSYYRLLGLVCPGILVALEMHSIVLVKQLNNEQNLDISCEVVCYCSRLRSIYIFSYLTLRQVDSQSLAFECQNSHSQLINHILTNRDPSEIRLLHTVIAVITRSNDNFMLQHIFLYRSVFKVAG